MGEKLYKYVKEFYADTKSDMSTVCMERCLAMCREDGMMSMINIPVWMFLSSYEKLRYSILKKNTYINMVHPGRGIFGSDFGTTTFVLAKHQIPGYTAVYRRLFDRTGEVETIEAREKAFFDGKGYHIAQQESFLRIPGAPTAYWVGENVFTAFSNPLLGDCFFAGHGLLTGHDEDMIYFWHEIDYTKIGFHFGSVSEMHLTSKKYAPATKGGDFRKWYGNLFYVAKYDMQTIEHMKIYPKFTPQNEDRYFHEGVSWNNITMRMFSPTYLPKGCIFNNKMPAVFSDNHADILKLAGFMSSKVCDFFTWLINPSVSCSAGVVRKIPICSFETWESALPETCISLSKTDWDSFETSWDFQRHPLVIPAIDQHYMRLADCWRNWERACNERFAQLKANEEELNRIFIDIYGLQDELTPEVDDKDVTVRKADLGRDIRSLISYAVGCMLGRYSIYKEGLMFAGGKWDEQPFAQACWDASGMNDIQTEGMPPMLDMNPQRVSMPDHDGILPITDDEYFSDDIVTMFENWLRVVYGATTLEENLAFIANALGGKGTPREVIRQYFLNDFYKDHLRIYQKRPIYWLFDSGKKNGFKALVYMHRWQPDTIARVRTDYVHEMQSRYRTAIADVEQRISGASTSDRVRLTKRLTALQAQAEELRLYEEKVHHLADQMIGIDLDDGVKVNYAKFADVLAGVK